MTRVYHCIGISKLDQCTLRTVPYTETRTFDDGECNKYIVIQHLLMEDQVLINLWNDDILIPGNYLLENHPLLIGLTNVHQNRNEIHEAHGQQGANNSVDCETEQIYSSDIMLS